MGLIPIHTKKLRYVPDCHQAKCPKRSISAPVQRSASEPPELPRRLRCEGRGEPSWFEPLRGTPAACCGAKVPLSRRSHAAACRGRGGDSQGLLFLRKAAVRAQGR